MLGPKGAGVFFCPGRCEDQCRALCLSAKINSNVKWQLESLRNGTGCLPPPPPLTTALRSMALSFTPCIPVHYPKIDVFVPLMSRYFFFVWLTLAGGNVAALFINKEKT